MKIFTLPEIPEHLRNKRIKTRIQKAINERLEHLHTIGGVNVFFDPKANAMVFTNVLNIDADGGPHCYHPSGKGLDYLANAGHPGNWWGIYCDPKTQRPLIQKTGDPAPGYYISTTSLVDATKKPSDQRRYANSEKIPYVALPAALFHGEHRVKLGDIGTVMANGKQSHAIVADSGGDAHIGEGSIFLAEQLGQPSNPKGSAGTTNKKIHYVIYLASALLRPDKVAGRLLNNSEIDAQATAVIQGRKITPTAYFA